jgi:predicted DNA-binding transcriptional regulator YafY
LVYFDQVRLLAAWCELREDFRHFRADRITALTETGQRYPHRRQMLQKQWQEIECKGPL